MLNYLPQGCDGWITEARQICKVYFVWFWPTLARLHTQKNFFETPTVWRHFSFLRKLPFPSPLREDRYVLAHDYVSASTERDVSCVGRFHHANLSQALSGIQGHLLGTSLEMLIPLGISLPFTPEARQTLLDIPDWLSVHVFSCTYLQCLTLNWTCWLSNHDGLHWCCF